MKATLKKIISSSSDLLSLDSLIRLSNQALIMPFYHVVSNESSIHTKHLYSTTSVDRFKRDLDFLQKNYEAVDANYLKLADSNSIKNQKKFLLTFDDGLREFHDVVAPILLERNIPAICFVNTDFIDNKDMFFRLKLSVMIEAVLAKHTTKAQEKLLVEIMSSVGLVYEKPRDLLKITDRTKSITDKIAAVLELDFKEYLSTYKPYLSSTEINNLISQGFTIGGHSMSHPYYPNLSEAEQVNETLNCMHFLQDNFEIESKLFSFPYTDFGLSKSFFEKIKNEIDFSFGTANLKLDEINTNFQRIPMEIMGMKNAKLIIKSEYWQFIIKRIFSKHIIHRF